MNGENVLSFKRRIGNRVFESSLFTITTAGTPAAEYVPAIARSKRSKLCSHFTVKFLDGVLTFEKDGIKHSHDGKNLQNAMNCALDHFPMMCVALGIKFEEGKDMHRIFRNFNLIA